MHVLDTYRFNESDDKNLSKKGNVIFFDAQGCFSAVCDQIRQIFELTQALVYVCFT